MNIKENKGSDKYGTHWATNILGVRQKNRLEMVRNKLFANPVLITQMSCLQTGSRTKCSQVYMQLYISRSINRKSFSKESMSLSLQWFEEDSECITASVSLQTTTKGQLLMWNPFFGFSPCFLPNAFFLPSYSPLQLVLSLLLCVSKYHVPIWFLSSIVILYSKKKLISTMFLKLHHGGYYLVVSFYQCSLEVASSPSFYTCEVFFFGTYNKRKVISKWIH